jgi:hypothetical protein
MPRIETFDLCDVDISNILLTKNTKAFYKKVFLINAKFHMLLQPDYIKNANRGLKYINILRTTNEHFYISNINQLYS